MGCNRNKRSVVRDLKRPAALDTLMRLVETADGFVHNMRAGAAQRLGIGYQAVAARNPKIVYAYATGYDRNRPHRDTPAYDAVLQGESWLAAMLGQANAEPRYTTMTIANKLSAVHHALDITISPTARDMPGQVPSGHPPNNQ